MTAPVPPRYSARARNHAGTAYGVRDTFTGEWVDDVSYPTLFRAKSAALRLNRIYDEER
jgi:hypothetical protein